MRCSQWPVWEAECPTQTCGYCDQWILPEHGNTVSIIAVTGGLVLSLHFSHAKWSVMVYTTCSIQDLKREGTCFQSQVRVLRKRASLNHVIIIQSGITSLHFQRSYPRIREQSPWTEWATRGSSQGRPGGFTEWTLSQIWAGEDYEIMMLWMIIMNVMNITITTLMMMKMF